MVRASFVEHGLQWIILLLGFAHEGGAPLLQALRCVGTDGSLPWREICGFMRIGSDIEKHLIRKEMVAIMVGAYVKPVAKPNGPLADMRALRDD